MCLQAQIRVRKFKTYTGYKVLDIDQNNTSFYFRGPLGQWIRDTSFDTITCWITHNGKVKKKEYPRGFHVFRDIRDAKNWVSDKNERIFKVYYRHIVASGKQDSKNHGLTDVSLEIFIDPDYIDPKFV